MVVAKAEREMLVVKVTDEHYLGEDEIHIDSEEPFHPFSYSSKTSSTKVSSVAIVRK
jgi:hypothetical protein